MTIVKNRLEAIVYMIQNSGRDHQTIADKSGVHRAQIHRWLTDDVGMPHPQSLKKVAEALGYDIHHEFDNIEITQKGKETNMEQQYQQQLISLQSKEILRLEDEIKQMITIQSIKPKPPKDLDEISDMLHDASEQWNWVFYKTDKPMSCARKGILRNVNPALCKLLGYSEDEMIGKNLLDFIHPDDHKRAVVEMKKSKRNIKVRVKKSSGNYCMIKITAQEFGVNGYKFSVALITCVQKGCPDL